MHLNTYLLKHAQVPWLSQGPIGNSLYAPKVDPQNIHSLKQVNFIHLVPPILFPLLFLAYSMIELVANKSSM